MLKQMPKLVLLVALVATFLVSSAPAFEKGCVCVAYNKNRAKGCVFDANLDACINTGCPGLCF